MNDTIFLILDISLIILIIKYINDLKSNKYLVSILALFGIPLLGFIIKYFFGNTILLSIGLFTSMIIAPLIFSIYLFINRKTGKEKNIRLLMIIPSLALLISYIFKLLHLEGAAVINLSMIIPVILGLIIVFKKKQIIETKPFQLILIFLIIDVITFLMKTQR